MDVEINEIRSTISSGDSSLVISFAFKFSFFFRRSRPEVLLGEGALEMCSQSAGELPVRGCDVNEVTK